MPHWDRNALLWEVNYEACNLMASFCFRIRSPTPSSESLGRSEDADIKVRVGWGCVRSGAEEQGWSGNGGGIFSSVPGSVADRCSYGSGDVAVMVFLIHNSFSFSVWYHPSFPESKMSAISLDRISDMEIRNVVEFNWYSDLIGAINQSNNIWNWIE